MAQGLAARDVALSTLVNRSRPCPAFFLTPGASCKRPFA